MFNYNNELSPNDLRRYSRQIVLEEFDGQQGQIKLKESRVCIVGAGGLGNSAALYSAALGFGSITIIDRDKLELSNLNRQIAYTPGDVEKTKSLLLVKKLKEFNPDIKISNISTSISFDNCMDILKNFDVVLDCTDNPHSRYCINDACARNKIPLVYGAAIRWDGQLTVYCYKDGPCLRCVYPVPPDPDIIEKCDDQGVVGPIVGIIGSMQAMEALKIVLGCDGIMSQRLFIFNGLRFHTRIIKLRPKRQDCSSCGLQVEIAKLAFSESSCERQYSIVSAENTLSVKVGGFYTQEYFELMKNKVPHVLLDVRVRSQYNSVRFDHAYNLSLEEIESADFCDTMRKLKDRYSEEQLKIVCILCRRGRKSRDAVDHFIKQLKFSEEHSLVEKVYNIEGGLQSWTKNVDSSFPYF